MPSAPTIIPELAVADPAAARALLTDVFGFTATGDMLNLGSQSVALLQAGGSPSHGRIDHLALAVNDVDEALAALLARGAVLDTTTPDGPQEIAEFWDSGVRYVFLRGPEGARIELCARRRAAPRPDLPGHDHVGIPCTDIAATEAFFRDAGLTLRAAVDLSRPDGMTKVRFLSLGTGVVELYQPPTPPAVAENALWHGLRLVGATGPKGTTTGPDGLRVTLL